MPILLINTKHQSIASNIRKNGQYSDIILTVEYSGVLLFGVFRMFKIIL